MNKHDLSIAIKNATCIYEKIKKKYSGIKGYLVFSSPYGQCEMTSSMQTIVEEFPEMVHDSIHKKRACELVQNIRDLREEIEHAFTAKSKSDLKKKMDDEMKNLKQVAESLEAMGDTFIEIRFKALDYNIIDKLRNDPIISLKHTPQTRASICIVLGTLDELKLTTVFE